MGSLSWNNNQPQNDWSLSFHSWSLRQRSGHSKKDLRHGLPQTLIEIPASSLALSLAHFSCLQATQLSADHVRHEQHPELSPSGFLHMIFRKTPTQTLFLFFVFVSALLFFPYPNSGLRCHCGCLSHNDTLIINPYTLEASVPGLGYIKILEYLWAKLCLQLRRQHRNPCPKLLFMQGFAERTKPESNEYF